MIRRVPVGVVGAITPWNSPSVLGMRVVAPALALGNAVVLKPDPQTPVCGGAMFAADLQGGRPARRAAPDRHRRRRDRRGAGHRPQRQHGLVHRLDRGRPDRRRAGRRPAQEGQPRARRQQPARSCSTTPTWPPPRAAGAYSSFQFQGQVCFATGRHIVHRSVADEYVDLLAQKARRLRTGDPYREDVDLGPIVNEKQVAARRRHRPALDRERRRAAGRGRHVRGAVLPTDRPGRREARLAGLDRRDLRPGGAGA